MTDYARIRAILDAATPGRWEVSMKLDPEEFWYGGGYYDIGLVDGEQSGFPADESQLPDARAIVVARNLAPELLAVAEAAAWAVDYIRRHGGVDNDYHDIERAAFADAALAALHAKMKETE